MHTTASFTHVDYPQPLNAMPVLGSAWTVQSFVQVRWGWVVYMAMEILLAAAFLVMTVLYTRRLKIRVLKSSLLATLLALDNEARSTVGGITTPSRMHSTSRHINVSLGGEDRPAASSGSSIWLGRTDVGQDHVGQDPALDSALPSSPSTEKRDEKHCENVTEAKSVFTIEIQPLGSRS